MPDPNGKPWSAARLKHTAEQRKKIMQCIHRHNVREQYAHRAVLDTGNYKLPRPYLREQIRQWYRERWNYLIREYEAILPHVNELPPEEVAAMVKSNLMAQDCADAKYREDYLPRR